MIFTIHFGGNTPILEKPKYVVETDSVHDFFLRALMSREKCFSFFNMATQLHLTPPLTLALFKVFTSLYLTSFQLTPCFNAMENLEVASISGAEITQNAQVRHLFFFRPQHLGLSMDERPMSLNSTPAMDTAP